MSDDMNPLEDAIEHAMDAFVYAPIGLVFDGPGLFPKLVRSGRNQVKSARMIGQLAVQMGQGEATKRVSKAQDQFRGSLATLGLIPPETGDEDAPPAAAATTAGSPKQAATKQAATKKAATKKAATKKAATKKSRKSTAKKATATKRAPTVSVDELAIPDYDSLSASQVVKRLRSLASDELDEVKAYESSTRARKTILNRITQLQKD